VPRVSDVVIVETVARPRAPARLPTSAPVTICVYLAGESATDLWPALYEGTNGVSIWQIQMHHPARPSILFDLISSWSRYI
jgi:hypothetical protein